MIRHNKRAETTEGDSDMFSMMFKQRFDQINKQVCPNPSSEDILDIDEVHNIFICS